ncbi:MAG: tetratricopeptide repeat protein [Verrucomicrobiales bacterium]|nr:MAG: tetratricopeptide repeat protein [Verrucomicrobiales bacterium]
MIMKLYRQTLVLLVTATFLAVECADAAKTKHVEQRIDAPRAQMTIFQARKTLVESLKHKWNEQYGSKTVQEMKINLHRITFVFAGSADKYDCLIAFAKIKNLSVMTTAGQSGGYVLSNGKVLRPTSVIGSNGKPLTSNSRPTALEDFGLPFFDTEDDALKFVDALLTLKAAEFAPDTEVVANFAAFTTEARTWLAATPKPEMSEEARTYKVLAEDAFKRKDFTAALDAYCDALDKYPMWPAGQYNAASLAAEAEDYDLAAQHMRRYLVLSPDAKDAQAAKDKLLLWQHKAKEQSASAPSEPASSDLIRVPTLEEMKKGAKIETIQTR